MPTIGGQLVGVLTTFPFPLLLASSTTYIRSEHAVLPTPASSIIDPLNLAIDIHPSLSGKRSPRGHFPSAAETFATNDPTCARWSCTSPSGNDIGLHASLMSERHDHDAASFLWTSAADLFPRLSKKGP